MKAEAGDKVRIKVGSYSGERGVIESVEGAKLAVRLEKSSLMVRVQSARVTNFSLAARKAWKTEPNRGVGRPKGTRLFDRVSVTLRIDRGVWDQFLEQEVAGTIEDRSSVINTWFREKLAELHGMEPRT